MLAIVLVANICYGLPGEIGKCEHARILFANLTECQEFLRTVQYTAFTRAPVAKFSCVIEGEEEMVMQEMIPSCDVGFYGFPVRGGTASFVQWERDQKRKGC